MIKIVWDAPFKQSYKKKIGSNEIVKTKFWKAINIFEQNPYDPKLKTHKLTGKLNGLYAFSVGYEYRVIFKFIENNKSALLIDIGTHDEVY